MAASSSFRMIDIAVNLTDGMFKGMYNGKCYHKVDIPAVLSRAWAAGVDHIIEDLFKNLKRRLQLQKLMVGYASYARLFCTVGVHPTRCKEFEDSGDPEDHLQELLSLAKEGIGKGKVVAIGECGLDYDRLHFCPLEVQKKYFERQFELAETLKLPMFLHMRAACNDFCEIFAQNAKSPKVHDVRLIGIKEDKKEKKRTKKEI